MNTLSIFKNRNNQQRYETLVNLYYKDVYRYGFWLCKNRFLAEDLVQETFLRAWRSFESLQSEKTAKAWLFTIIRRENARRYQRYIPVFVDTEEQSIVDLVDNAADQILDNTLLYKAIDRLKKEHREPLLLQLIGGFTSKEIAELLNLNSNTVTTRLFRARKKLKDEYLPEDDQVKMEKDEQIGVQTKSVCQSL